MQHAISARGIVKEFPAGEQTIRVLHEADIDVPVSELSMLVGPSGCGKTTLISILTGILTPTAGEVEVLGENLTAMAGSDKVVFRREAFGFIFQQYNLLSALTAAENAAVILVAGGMKLNEARDKSAAILEKIGMADHINKLPDQLSGGQQQRVAIARALAHDPDILVCDEPTASLDAHSGHRVMEILDEVARTPGRAVLVVTHDNRIFEFADRIFHMSDGVIERTEIPKETPHE